MYYLSCKQNIIYTEYISIVKFVSSWIYNIKMCCDLKFLINHQLSHKKRI